jgi:hypothetical protein
LCPESVFPAPPVVVGEDVGIELGKVTTAV